VDTINAERNTLSEAIQSLQTDVERLQCELQVSEEKMQMIVQYSDDRESLGSEGECGILGGAGGVILVTTTISRAIL
jgi:hypothetical protein